jgi:hypothetical protein
MDFLSRLYYENRTVLALFVGVGKISIIVFSISRSIQPIYRVTIVPHNTGNSKVLSVALSKGMRPKPLDSIRRRANNV